MLPTDPGGIMPMMNLMNIEKAPILLVSASTVKISVCEPINMALIKEL